MRLTAAICGAILALLWIPSPATADDPLTIIIGAQPSAFYQVIDYVAEYAGYYRQQHVAVTLQFAGNASLAAELVASGKADLGAETVYPLIQGYDKGVRLRAFFLRTTRSQYTLAVADDSPIRSLADFKGATLGEYSIGSSVEPYVSAMLLGAGLSRSDFSFISIGNGGAAIQAIASKKVAGAAFPYLELLSYEQSANQKYRFFFNSLLEDIGDSAFIASDATLQAKADVIRRFCRANAMAAIFIRVNPQLAARYFLQGAGIKVTDEAVADEAQMLELARDSLPGSDPMSKTIGTVPPRGMGVLSRFLYQSGLTKQIVPASAVVDDEFTAYANDFDHQAVMAQAKQMR
jgi:NitT/TauT family transport system substrate-binding protein